jgi:hypothetical protein
MKTNKLTDRKLKLLVQYNNFSSPQERERWYRSLRLEDRNLIKDSIPKETNALF